MSTFVILFQLKMRNSRDSFIKFSSLVHFTFSNSNSRILWIDPPIAFFDRLILTFSLHLHVRFFIQLNMTLKCFHSDGTTSWYTLFELCVKFHWDKSAPSVVYMVSSTELTLIQIFKSILLFDESLLFVHICTCFCCLIIYSINLFYFIKIKNKN